MRPLGPEPGTRPRSTPSSRASLRTLGPACALANASPSIAGATASGSSQGGGTVSVGPPYSLRGGCRARALLDERLLRLQVLEGRNTRRAGFGGRLLRRRRLQLRGGRFRQLLLHLQPRDRRALGHLVADLHQDLAHHAAGRRRNVHRRLVGFEREEWSLGGNLVAGLDEDLDDRNVLEVADVRNQDVHG